MINLTDHITYGDKWLYDTLLLEKLDVFPDDHRIEFLYTADNFNNSQSPGKTLMRLQEYLAILDIPNFFVVIHSSKQDISKDLSEARRVFAPTDEIIKHQIIDGTFNAIYQKQNTFCIMPWTHIHVNAQGLVGPCCQFDANYPVADLANTTINDCVNNDHFKLIRKQMINGERPTTCNNCWIQEDLGARSQRQENNSRYGDYQQLIDNTNETGEFDFKLESFDFRASNICNMRCRMCGGKYSSRLAIEEVELYPNIRVDQNYLNFKLSDSQVESVLSFIKKNVNNLKYIYFAGGEPLIMGAHYRILDLLLEHNRTDLLIKYNTNFSLLSYKDISVIDYWNKFKNISIKASIDLLDERANYVRNGADYQDLEKNYWDLPTHVLFKIDSTYTVYNAFDLIKLQRRWISKFNLSPDVLKIRTSMLPPGIMSCQVLPKIYKDAVSIEINNHINWLLTIKNSESLVNRWKDVLQFMYQDDQSHLLGKFFEINDAKDKIRNECFEDVFPEYKDLRSYV